MNRMFLRLILILLVSCSSSQSVKNANAEDKDLMKEFSLEGSEFDKFKDSDTPVAITPTPPPPPVETPTPTPIAKKTKGKKEKPIVTPTPVLAPVGFVYPKDYPADFIKSDETSEKFWKDYRPNVRVGESLTIEAKYFGVTVGKIILNTMPMKYVGAKKAFHFNVNLTSAPFYKWVYEISDQLDCYVEEESFKPLKYMLVQRESKQNVDDLQLFDNDKLKAFYRYKKFKKKDKSEFNESKEEFVPRFYQDSFSILYFLRGFNFSSQTSFEIPIVTRGKSWVLKAVVDKKEEINTPIGKRQAYKINATTHYPGVLSSKGEATFWFSADEQRQLLKFAAKVKLGTIEGDIIEAKDGTPYTK